MENVNQPWDYTLIRNPGFPVITNAFAEFSNAKVKAFRRQIRGVVYVKYFLFRLCKIYA